MSEGCLHEVREMVRAILGTADVIAPTARLEADLQLESLDLLDLGEGLRSRYGPAVDLCGHVATLEFDELIDLTVGEVAAYVARAVGR